MIKKLLLLGVVVLLNGCTKFSLPFPLSLQDQMKNVDSSSNTIVVNSSTYYEGGSPQNGQTIEVNALDTVVPQRTEEEIMRGVMLPYQAEGVLHDSRYIYLVSKPSEWLVKESVKVRDKTMLGGVNGI